MKSEDFVKLINFTEIEVGSTGANYGDVQFETMQALQFVRTSIGAPIELIDNGLTTGNHVSEYHPAGLAVDYKFLKKVDIKKVVYAMIRCGFTGIGVYKWPDGHYTFHGDLRPIADAGSWFRVTDVFGVQRDYSIFNDKML